MDMMFFMPMKPPTVTAQMHRITVRNGRPMVYDTPAIKEARNKIIAELYKHRPKQPITGAIRLAANWQFPCGKHKPGTWRTSRPDTDNLQKLLKDCMTECGFWKDDAQVVNECVAKYWSDKPGIYIEITVLDNE